MAKNNFKKYNQKQKQLKEKRKNQIANITRKQEQFLQMLGSTGHATMEQATKITYRENILKLQKIGLVDKQYQRYASNHYVGYFLTKEGRKYYKKRYNSKPYSRQSVAHDREITSIYLQLDEREKLSFLTEEELKTIAIEKNISGENISACDFAYTESSTGQIILGEIITKYYKQDQIQQKRNFAAAIGADLKEVII